MKKRFYKRGRKNNRRGGLVATTSQDEIEEFEEEEVGTDEVSVLERITYAKPKVRKFRKRGGRNKKRGGLVASTSQDEPEEFDEEEIRTDDVSEISVRERVTYPKSKMKKFHKRGGRKQRRGGKVASTSQDEEDLEEEEEAPTDELERSTHSVERVGNIALNLLSKKVQLRKLVDNLANKTQTDDEEKDEESFSHDVSPENDDESFSHDVSPKGDDEESFSHDLSPEKAYSPDTIEQEKGQNKPQKVQKGKEGDASSSKRKATNGQQKSSSKGLKKEVKPDVIEDEEVMKIIGELEKEVETSFSELTEISDLDIDTYEGESEAEVTKSNSKQPIDAPSKKSSSNQNIQKQRIEIIFDLEKTIGELEKEGETPFPELTEVSDIDIDTYEGESKAEVTKSNVDTYEWESKAKVTKSNGKQPIDAPSEKSFSNQNIQKQRMEITFDLEKTNNQKTISGSSIFSSKEVGGLVCNGPYSRILLVSDSRLENLKEFWPKYAFIRPQFLVKPNLTLENLQQTILANTQLPHLENGTLLMCSVGLHDIITLHDFKDCYQFKNHKPMKVMSLKLNAMEDLIKLVLLRLKNAYEILEKSLDSSSVVCFTAIIPCDPEMFFKKQARNHKPNNHAFISSVMCDNFNITRERIKEVCDRVNKHLNNQSPLPSLWDIMATYHRDRQIVKELVFYDGIRISQMTAKILSCRLNRFFQEMFYGAEINQRYIEFNQDQEVIVVGDSRLMALEKVWVGDKPIFYCEPELGFYNLSKYIEENLIGLKNKIVIICLGLNDLVQFKNDYSCLGKDHEANRTPVSVFGDEKTSCVVAKIFKNIISSICTFTEKNSSMMFFCTVYPIHIHTYLNCQLQTHKEKTGHDITPPKIESENIENLKRCVSMFNSNLRKMCKMLMLPLWDMQHVVCRGFEISTLSKDVLKDGIYPSSRTAEELIRSYHSFLNEKLMQESKNDTNEYQFPTRPLPTYDPKSYEMEVKAVIESSNFTKEESIAKEQEVKTRKEKSESKRKEYMPCHSRPNLLAVDTLTADSKNVPHSRQNLLAVDTLTADSKNVPHSRPNLFAVDTLMADSKNIPHSRPNLLVVDTLMADSKNVPHHNRDWSSSPESRVKRSWSSTTTVTEAKKSNLLNKGLSPTISLSKRLSPISPTISLNKRLSPTVSLNKRLSPTISLSPERSRFSQVTERNNRRHTGRFSRSPEPFVRDFRPRLSRSPEPAERYRRYSRSPERSLISRYPRSPERSRVCRYPRSPERSRVIRYPRSPERLYKSRYSRSPDTGRSPDRSHRGSISRYSNRHSDDGKSYEPDVLSVFLHSIKMIRKQCYKEKEAVVCEALLDLCDVHYRECELYLNKPDAHPDYAKEYRLFIERKKVFISDLGGDPNTYDYLTEWEKFWPTRIFELFIESWIVKKDQCKKMLLKRRRVSSSSLSSSSSDASSSPHRKKKRSKRKSHKHLRWESPEPKSEATMKSDKWQPILQPHNDEDSKSDFVSYPKPPPKIDINIAPKLTIAAPVEEAKKTKSLKVVEVLGILAYMKDKLDVFGMPISILYEKAVDMEKKGVDPTLILEDDESASLLNMLNEKLTAILEDGNGSAIQKAIILEARSLLKDLLAEIAKLKKKNEPPELKINVAQIALLTLDKSISETISIIKSFLLYEGYTDISKEQLEGTYLLVKEEQLKRNRFAPPPPQLTSSSSLSMTSVLQEFQEKANRLDYNPRPTQVQNSFLPPDDLTEEFFIGLRPIANPTASNGKRQQQQYGDASVSYPSTSKAFSSRFNSPDEELDEEFFTGRKFMKPSFSDPVAQAREGFSSAAASTSAYVPHRHVLPPPPPMLSGMPVSRMHNDASRPPPEKKRELNIPNLDYDKLQECLNILKNV